MRVQRITNPDLIKQFMANPETWDIRAEDGVSVDEVQIVIDPRIFWLALLDKDEDQKEFVRGVAVASPLSKTIFDFHVCFDPKFWRSKNNVELGKLALEWYFLHSGANKIVSTIPVASHPACRYVQRIGMKREGVNRASFMKAGVLTDQYYFGITKADVIVPRTGE